MKRLFRGLRRPPDPSYDAVVIGSGIGGLITANLLAKDGLKVLLVEQHYMVGVIAAPFAAAATPSTPPPTSIPSLAIPKL